MSETPTRKELLVHAARCFRNARLDRDACRCLEAAARFGESALIHRQMSRWAEAARCFEEAENWRAAARCHLEDGQPAEAARCLISAGDPLEAGWILAHLAHRYDQARAVLARFSPDEPADGLARDLALGRCDTPRKPAAAGRAVRAVVRRLGDIDPGPGRDRVLEWALVLAVDVLDRPDLALALFTAAAAAGASDIHGRWEAWAEDRLGTLEGVITEPEEEEETL